MKEVSRKGVWIEIVPTEKAYAFVAAEYLKQDVTLPAVPPIVSIPPTETNLVADAGNVLPPPVDEPNTNDVATGTATTQFPIHGGRNNEGRMTIDGLNIGNPPGGNQPPGFSVDVGNSEEISFTTSGGLGESETAGLTMNVVPKTNN